MTLTAAQMALRLGKIPASLVPAICGVDSYVSPHEAYCEILGIEAPSADQWSLEGDEGAIVEESNGPFKHTPIEVGHALEEAVASNLYARPRGFWIARGYSLVDPDRPWAMATPDFGVLAPGVSTDHHLTKPIEDMLDWRALVVRNVEVKVVGARRMDAWGDAGDAIPKYYRPQVVWQQEVTRVFETDVVALLGGTDCRVYTIKRDERLAKAVTTLVTRFYEEHVVRRVPPDPDGSKGARAMLLAAYPKPTRDFVVADAEANGLAIELDKIREQYAEIKKAKERLEQLLQQRIGDAEGIVGKGWKATWPATKPVEVKAHVRAASRRFTFKFKGEEV